MSISEYYYLVENYFRYVNSVRTSYYHVSKDFQAYDLLIQDKGSQDLLNQGKIHYGCFVSKDGVEPRRLYKTFRKFAEVVIDHNNYC